MAMTAREERQARADGRRCDMAEVGRLEVPDPSAASDRRQTTRRSPDPEIHDGDAKTTRGPARGLLHITSSCIQKLLTIMGCYR
jgi:hypothetical protein